MEYTILGNTGIKVSRLCFGALTVGPLQADMPVEEGAEIIVKALENGVNFIDTAELYETYPHIRRAMEKSGIVPVISTKSYAYSREDARKSFEKARKELNIDVIDIFSLHEQESRLTLRGHREAIEFYLEQKAAGKIRAVGVSTHNVEVVRACAEMPEIDVIHPLINMTGIGIGDGTLDEMLEPVKLAFDKGKGIFSMKPLGGGTLIRSYRQAMEFIRNLPFIHSVAIGMQFEEEVLVNTAIFSGKDVPDGLLESLMKKNRTLHIDFWCEGCGNCVKRCSQRALSLKDGKAAVDREKCILCSYCAAACPVFAIKVV